MSSILKALRKAEEQSPKLDITTDLLKGVDTKRAVSRRAKGSRAYRRIIISAVVVIILGLGTWVALHSRELLPVKVADNPSQITKAEQVTAPKAELPPAKVEEVPAPKVEQASAPVPLNVEKSVEAVKSAEAPKEKAVPPEVGKIADPKQDAVFPGATKKEQPAPQQSAKVIHESHPEDSKFKLEAIVWSENPDSRFAVVNGQILRKGGSIEGLSVTAIEKDFIAVRKSGRDWTLKFTVD